MNIKEVVGKCFDELRRRKIYTFNMVWYLF